MNSVAPLLKALRNRTVPKISSRDVAALLGIPPSSYAFYEDEKKYKKPTLPFDLAKQLAAIFAERGVPLSDTLFLAGLTEEIGQYHAAAPAAPESQSVALRHVDLSYSMGPGANIDDYVEEGSFEFDATLLSRITRSPSDRLFVASGAGDSMFPTLLDSDLVVIDTGQRIMNMQDRIWALSLFGAGAIKRLRTVGSDRILVISDNKDVENQEVSADDIHLLGRVVWLGRRL